MKNILVILFFFLSIILNAQTKYYVATDGNDSNPGTIDLPWKTWGKAFNASEVDPGDTVYFRGGVYYKKWGEGDYYHLDAKSYRIDNAGTAGNYVNFWAYPDEIPILDSDSIVPITNLNYAMRGGADYTYFKGLHIRNVWSVEGGINGASVQAHGWKAEGNQMKVENCKFYNIHGVGLQLNGNDTIYVTNCDAWNCCDSFAISPQLPGNRGSGFTAVNSTVTYTAALYKFKGCRAWNCGDQGFSGLSYGDIEWDSCWSFLNGQLQGGGHGWKLGWAQASTGCNRKVTNSIAAYNREIGFTSNDATEPNHYVADSLLLWNNTAYKNGDPIDYQGGYGFVLYETGHTDAEEYRRRLVNNISYANEIKAIYTSALAVYTHSNNSWDSDVTVTDADFVSVDSTGLTNARGEDGSLPDLDFLELVSTSDLIDAGTDVGLTYYNDAPDIGFFEYPEFPETAAPYINTNEPIITRSRDVTAGGNMIFDGGGTISSKGVCISQESDPDIADTVIYAGTGTDDFTIRVPNLTKSTTYHVRAYATNETGTAYGADVEFTTPASSPVKTGGKLLKHGNYYIKIE